MDVVGNLILSRLPFHPQRMGSVPLSFNEIEDRMEEMAEEKLRELVKTGACM